METTYAIILNGRRVDEQVYYCKDEAEEYNKELHDNKGTVQEVCPICYGDGEIWIPEEVEPTQWAYTSTMDCTCDNSLRY